jgi:hypothetical protein
MRTGIQIALFLLAFAVSACAAAPAAAEEAPATAPTSTPSARATPTLSFERPPDGADREFSTDFTKHSVPYADIFSGGPPKDGIPAIDAPTYVSVSEADAWLAPQEPVILVQVGDAARAYPIQILMWHEIVNDTLGDLPLLVTFCPLCNTAIAFERTLNGDVLDFGTTGRLRFSNLIMYDRQSESWWQQAVGDAIAGAQTGAQLTFYPATIVAWEAFRNEFPKGTVLSRDTGFARDYGRNPYLGYDDVNASPFLFRGPETPGALPPMARVLTVEKTGEAVAYPYALLEEMRVINDVVGGTAVVVFWTEGTASALDASTVADGRDVGAAVPFVAEVEGRRLTFAHVDDQFVDVQTGSVWNLLGAATEGELAGKQLAPVVGVNHFWFSWAAFKPETRIYQP